MKAYTCLSTTGTAPITFTRVPGGVRIDLDDGSAQVYSVVDLAAAVLGVALNIPTPTPDGWDEPCGYLPTDAAVSVPTTTNEA